MESIGFYPIDLSNYNSVILDEFYGSYFSKAKPFNIQGDILTYYEFYNLEMDIVGDRKYDSIYDISKAELRDKYSLFLRGNNSLTIIKNSKLQNNKISDYINENNFDNIIILYNFINLATDNNILKIKY